MNIAKTLMVFGKQQSNYLQWIRNQTYRG